MSQVFRLLLQSRHFKVFLSLLVLFLTLVALTFTFNKPQKTDSLSLTAQNNQFHLAFNYQPQNQEAFLKFLSNLGLPPETAQGLDFKLDATSSAKLAFASPINASFKVSEKEFTLTGTKNGQKLEEFTQETVKLPASANLIIFAPNFFDFIKSKLTMPENFSTWLSANLVSKNGQTLAIFGQNSDFVIVWRNPKADFESLKNLSSRIDEEGSVYKEETQDGITLYLMRLPQKVNPGLTVTFFQIGEIVFFTSSHESAQELVSIQKSKLPAFTFGPAKIGEKASIALTLRQTENLPSSFFQLLSLDEKRLKSAFSKIKEINFSLKASGFSGLIVLK